VVQDGGPAHVPKQISKEDGSNLLPVAQLSPKKKQKSVLPSRQLPKLKDEKGRKLRLKKQGYVRLRSAKKESVLQRKKLV
jgi:hypothetical protein